MRRLFKLAVFVLAALSAWRIGAAYLAHYEFDDAVSQIAQRAAQSRGADVQTAVEDAARRLAIPLDPGQMTITVEGEHVYIDLRYARPVEVLPRYFYPWPFSVRAHGWVLGAGAPASSGPTCS